MEARKSFIRVWVGSRGKMTLKAIIDTKDAIIGFTIPKFSGFSFEKTYDL